MAFKGVNKVTLIGHLGADPEARYLPSGIAITTFNVATSETWKDKETGEQKTHTEWHRVVVKARLAEIAGEYLKKGSKVYLEGANRTRKWTDKQGIERYSTEVHCREMQMLDSRSDHNQAGQQAQQPVTRQEGNSYLQASEGLAPDQGSYPNY